MAIKPDYDRTGGLLRHHDAASEPIGVLVRQAQLPGIFGPGIAPEGVFAGRCAG